MTLAPDLHAAAADAADPPRVRLALERLVEAHAGLGERLVGDPELLAALVAVTGISDSLTRVLLVDAAAVDAVGDLEHRPAPPELAADAHPSPLVAWKQRETARIAARDQLGHDSLDATTELLSRLASDVAHGAVVLAGVERRLAVIGMGKLGARELNYASDIDVMFTCADDDDPTELAAPAREVLSICSRCFRTDANLRPEGRNGPLVRTLPSYEAYWEEWAEPWEFQALIKARAVAGPDEVGHTFDELAAQHLWQRTLSADDLRSLRALKARAEEDASTGRDGEREIKRSPGGIRDVEFSVQLLQLVHGRNDPALREPNTLAALAELGQAGYAARSDAQALIDAYRFLRDVEHRLQLVEEQPVYAVPSGSAQLTRLARSLGFRDTAQADAVSRFHEALTSCRTGVRSIHERLYFRPLLEAFSGAEGTMSVEAAEERLAAFGFREARRTKEAVRELTRGLTRSSRLMQQLLPLLLEWLSNTPDPDLGLLALRTLTTGTTRTNTLVQTFRESPETARRLCVLTGTSRLVGDLLHHNPELAAALGDDSRLQPRTRERLVERATTALDWRDVEERQTGLKRFTDREGLRVMAADILGLIDTVTVGTSLTLLAESALEAALVALSPPMPFAVVALGRFGGSELSYTSDLDVIFVHDGDDGAADALEVAGSLLKYVGGATPARRVYDIDADLRPEGRNGALSRTVDSYVTYHERWAEPWERQALVRARVVAGDHDLGNRLLERLTPLVWDAPLTDSHVRELRRIKARVEKERIPPGDDPQFHLKLGKGTLSDVEWTAQLLQLQHRVREPSTIGALHALVAAGALPADDAAVLEESYRFCERTRNRWHLIQGRTGDALPTAATELGRLARSLDSTPVALRQDYRRVTRRARRVMEHHFYGRER